MPLLRLLNRICLHGRVQAKVTEFGVSDGFLSSKGERGKEDVERALVMGGTAEDL